MSWRDDVTEERPTFAPSTLADGDSMTVTFLGDGREEQTRNGEATVFGVTVVEAPDDAQDMNEQGLSEGEDYDLMTSSSRLLYELADYAEDLNGQTVEIRAEGAAKSFERHYYAE